LEQVFRSDVGRISFRTAQCAERDLSWAWDADDPWVVGDWAVLDQLDNVVERVQRKNMLARRAVGRRDRPQLTAANVGAVLIVMALDADFSVRRVERYLTLAHAAQVPPIILLTKAAGCPDLTPYLAQVEIAARGAEVYAIMVGSSGVGKSTLLNHLAQRTKTLTAEVRERDGKGRHTTTWRELHILPNGAALIDTPGMREVQLWASSEALAASFDDVAALAEECRYSDCKHGGEPGCAIAAAIAGGELEAERMDSFTRLRGELTQQGTVQRRAKGSRCLASLAGASETEARRRLTRRR
jgi:ribosome biogenesis GTPase